MRTVKCPSLSNKLPGTPLSSNPTREEFRPSRRCRVWSTRCKRVHNLETLTGLAVIMEELGASSEGRGMQNALWIGVFLRNRNPYCTSIKGTNHVMFEALSSVSIYHVIRVFTQTTLFFTDGNHVIVPNTLVISHSN